MLGNNIHIAAYSAIYGGEDGVFIEDFSNISSRVTIYSISDDYFGNTITNPTISEEYKHIHSSPVVIKRHCIIGSTSVILPGTVLEEGSAFGAFSFVKENSEPWSINVGIPIHKIADRSRRLLEQEMKYKLS